MTPILKLALPLILLMSYSEWFLRTFEMQAIYPFNGSRIAPSAAGERRLRETLFKTPDGETLILWIAAPIPAAPTILYLPGNAGNLATRAKRFSQFLDRGYGVVALGYRGSSGSSGSPSEETLSADALLIFDALAHLLGAPMGPVVLYGESLGTAMAIKIAAVRDTDAVVLEAPFTSMADLAKFQYPSIDLTAVLTQIWDTAARVGEVTEPLLILHGTADDLVPIEQGRRVFRLAGSRQKWIEPLPGVGHQGIWTAAAMKALYAFLDRL